MPGADDRAQAVEELHWRQVRRGHAFRLSFRGHGLYFVPITLTLWDYSCR